MNKNSGIRVKRLHAGQCLRLELVMNDAGALPAEHVCPGLLLDVASQMAVGCPDNLLTQAVQVLNQFNGDARRNNPVCARFHCCRRIGVNHHGPVRMGIAEGREFVNRTAEIQ